MIVLLTTEMKKIQREIISENQRITISELLADLDFSYSDFEPISNRRGAILVKLNHAKKVYALKLAFQEEDSVYSALESLEREIVFLSSQPEFSGNLLLKSGQRGNFTWLLRHWSILPSLHSQIISLRTSNKAQTKINNLIASFLLYLENLHETNWLHGDIQPGHIMMDEKNTPYLIDWGLAHKRNSNFSYQGALIHYAAPEVASAMLAESLPIRYDKPQEIFAAGATLFTLYTNHTPWQPLEEKEPVKRRIQLLNNIIANRRLPFLLPEGCQQNLPLESIINSMMSPNPDERPKTLIQLSETLL
jgi:serine/threonine protein kinase